MMRMALVDNVRRFDGTKTPRDTSVVAGGTSVGGDAGSDGDGVLTSEERVKKSLLACAVGIDVTSKKLSALLVDEDGGDSECGERSEFVAVVVAHNCPRKRGSSCNCAGGSGAGGCVPIFEMFRRECDVVWHYKDNVIRPPLIFQQKVSKRRSTKSYYISADNKAE